MNQKILLPAVILGWTIIVICTILSFMYGRESTPFWHLTFEPLIMAANEGKGDAGIGNAIFLVIASITLWVMTILSTILLFKNFKKSQLW